MASSIRFGSRSVRAASGEEWRIGRRWVTRARPRWRKVEAGKAASEALLAPDIGGPEDLAAWLAIVVGAVVVAIVVIPLLLFGIELVVLGVVIAAGILGRGLLGRPWTVTATRVGAADPAWTWRVSGWRRSGRLIDEAAASLAAGLDPSPGEASEHVTSVAA